MDLLTPALTGISLSMDCFAVSLAIGPTTKNRLTSAAAVIALFFGAFQAGMIVLGWGAGTWLIGMISSFDHWIAFGLLAGVGGKMIWEGLHGDGEPHISVIAIIPVIVLSLATSIDALAVGVSFGVLKSSIFVPALIVGVVCFAISFAGVMLGKRLGNVLGHRMEILGGLILVLLGLRILYGHLTG